MATPDIPVYHVAVGSAALLAAAGVILAIVPALRRRRALVITWVLSVSALSLAALVNLALLLHEFTCPRHGRRPEPADSRPRAYPLRARCKGRAGSRAGSQGDN